MQARVAFYDVTRRHCDAPNHLQPLLEFFRPEQLLMRFEGITGGGNAR